MLLRTIIITDKIGHSSKSSSIQKSKTTVDLGQFNRILVCHLMLKFYILISNYFSFLKNTLCFKDPFFKLNSLLLCFNSLKIAFIWCEKWLLCQSLSIFSKIKDQRSDFRDQNGQRAWQKFETKPSRPINLLIDDNKLGSMNSDLEWV